MPNSMTSYSISGMTCGACEKAISRRILKIEGVLDVQVSAPNGTLSIDATHPVSQAEVTTALENTHYKIINNL